MLNFDFGDNFMGFGYKVKKIVFNVIVGLLVGGLTVGYQMKSLEMANLKILYLNLCRFKSFLNKLFELWQMCRVTSQHTYENK